ncbi:MULTISPECIES: hypothetical protein [unclassified Streptomyces]|uniref:hypothetical protein n=1 Tax=unclassified Streptomyces TaxID=2593676 RepID=UPI00225004DA|nr:MULTISPECIES: hypothetical protein [unclassified Streptomyces]MCX5049871.1 hypothetical protein [Streptomyces sp. NBC_00474]
METIAVGLLMAFAGSTASAAGQQAWQSLRGLVTRRSEEDGGEATGGRRELATLDEQPDSVERARALAHALAVRAERDREFARQLQVWRQEAEAARGEQTGAGDVHVEFSGTSNGPVVVGRDFHGTINLG